MPKMEEMNFSTAAVRFAIFASVIILLCIVLVFEEFGFGSLKL